MKKKASDIPIEKDLDRAERQAANLLKKLEQLIYIKNNVAAKEKLEALSR